ncbi:MAG: pseudaminic acid cytidylyltransferase [Sterolibacteriaceae bacterium MAG5]|nr:pseudaminic acid cytidylyltransferase [Candidatus Nitricoxidireducens bremensis]
MSIAIIPARGGSKRIPRKNLKPFCGVPILNYSIECAAKTEAFSHVIVSSDDAVILGLAREKGCVALPRPASLADDFTGTIPVIRHAILWAQSQGFDFEHVACIYATAPLLRVTDLLAGLDAVKGDGRRFSFSATTFDYPIYRGLVRDEQGVRMIFPENFNRRSQDLPEALHDAAQFYWGTAAAWLADDLLFSKYSAPVLIPRYRVQDIDTEEDWCRAELIYRILKETGDL